MWTESERKAYEWFKTNYDSEAKLIGNLDSTQSDIFSPLFNHYIEIKQLMPAARCGQFTKTTAIYDLCQEVMNDNWTEENAKQFVKLHYLNKDVSHFIIVLKDNIILETLDSFLENYNFNWQSYAKKSGTSKVSKKNIPLVMSSIAAEIKNDRLYAMDINLIGTYFWIGGIEFFVSKNKNTYGEIRQCSKTKNITWLVEVSK